MPSRKDGEGKPQISRVSPTAAIAGGEFQIRGKGFVKAERPRVTFGDVEAPVIIGSDSFIITRVPEGASVGELIIQNGEQASSAYTCELGIQIADSVHPVTNPAVDAAGSIFTTFSGSRGQKTPVSVYKVDLNYTLKPFLSDVMNATALAFDREGLLHISSRYDGVVYQATPTGNMSVYVEGMGVATGLAFDDEENLYVGDRQGTIFKISRVAADLRFRHPGTVNGRLSHGVRPRGLPVRERSDDFEFRRGAPDFAGRRSRGVLPRARPPARRGIRRRGPVVRGGIAGRAEGRGPDRCR